MTASLSSSARRKKSRSQTQLSLNKWSLFQYKHILLIFSIIGIVLALVATALFNMYMTYLKQLKVRDMNWKDDVPFLESLEKQMGMESLYTCDLPVYDLKLRPHDIHLINEITLEFPFLLRNSIDHWKAFERWTKTNFSSLYGAQIVHIGTESSIVYGGGSTVTPVSIKEYLQHMNKVDEIYQSSDSSSSSLSSSPFSSILSSTTSFLSTLAASSSSSSSRSSSSKSNSNNGNKNKNQSSSSPALPIDSFVFDVSILNSKHTLKNDFRIPRYFLTWDNPETYQNGTAYHMLSLGSSRTGLPFHYHGHTWLGLVYGNKLWLIYPPGLSPPERLEREYNPLLPVQQWLKDIYPLLLEFPRPWRFIRDEKTGIYEPTNPEETGPPVVFTSTSSSSSLMSSSDSTTTSSSTTSNKSISSSTSASTDASTQTSSSSTSSSSSAAAAAYFPKEVGGDYRPLQCLQRSGDLLYLPAGWLHMTINIGESIGIGGQALLTAQHRYDLSLSTLELYPESFDALKGVGIAAAHMAMEITDMSKDYAKSLMITKYIIKLKSHKQFIQMIDNSEDIWLLLFYSHVSADIHEMQSIWQAVAARLQGLICVGIFDMTLVSDEESDILYGVNKTGLDQQTEVRLYLGGMRPKSVSRNYAQFLTTPAVVTITSNNNISSTVDISSNSNNSYNNYTSASTTATATSTVTNPPYRYVTEVELNTLGITSLFELTSEIVTELNSRLFQYGIRYDNTPLQISNTLSNGDDSNNIDNDDSAPKIDDIDSTTNITASDSTTTTSVTATATTTKQPSMAESISDFALDLLMNPHLRLQHGCIASVTAKARRLFKMSERHLRRALDHHPLHPEVRGALAEVLGHAGEPTEMRRVIEETVQLFEVYTSHIDNPPPQQSAESQHQHVADGVHQTVADGVENNYKNNNNNKSHKRNSNTVSSSLHASSASLASLYHRLGTIFLTQKGEDVKDSLPLFLKSLSIDPLFTPALADSARVHLHLNHSHEAADTIATLSTAAPTHPHLTSLKKKLRHLLEMKKLG